MSFWTGTRWIREDRTPKRPKWRPGIGDWVSTGVMLFALALLVFPTYAAFGRTSVFVVEPTQGAAGDRVMVTGARFAPRQRLQLAFDGRVGGMPAVTVARDGTFEATFIVPRAAPGPHTVSIRTTWPGFRFHLAGRHLASATFRVIGDRGAPIAPDVRQPAEGTGADEPAPTPSTGPLRGDESVPPSPSSDPSESDTPPSPGDTPRSVGLPSSTPRSPAATPAPPPSTPPPSAAPPPPPPARVQESPITCHRRVRMAALERCNRRGEPSRAQVRHCAG